MFKNKRLIAWSVLLLLCVAVISCKSKFEKLKASNNTAKKYQEALRLYNKKSYTKALDLFDDLMQRYRGKSEAEDLSYYSAYTNYRLKDYTTARYQFKLFADTYPSSAKAEECRYMSAYCYYLDSPNSSLDQENTLKAIEALQLFINLYPKSDRVAEASKLIDNLRDKLETKSFLNAKMYFEVVDPNYNHPDYKSAVIAFKNTLRDFPDTKYAEEIEFLIVKAQYEYAKLSLQYKQEERYNEAIQYSNDFLEKYPQSKFGKDAKELKISSDRDIINVKKEIELNTAAYKADSIKRVSVK